MFAWLASLNAPRRWALAGGAIVAVFLLGALSERANLRSPFGPGEGGATVQRPRPAEFLYLDNERVAAYLGQLNGGIAKSERLSETLRNEESAKVTGEFFEVGASAQRENFVERQVTPTAAANFFRLLAVLLQQEKLEEVSVDSLDEFEGLGEGVFVSFVSHDMRAPVYANSYLVVRQAGTLKALFPTAGADEHEREAILARRESAKSYARQVGPNPRIVFALTPKASASGDSRKDDSIKFLLPVRYRQLTDERSLIKDGGGRFTVVGKVVRIFPKSPRRSSPVYVDSPTRETWTKPLERVPQALLEYSSRKCTPADGGAAGDTAATLGDCVMSRLEEQTAIPEGGAVILPVAIYK